MSETLSASGLIFAYRLDGKGGGVALDLRTSLVPADPLLSGTHWLHFASPGRC